MLVNSMSYDISVDVDELLSRPNLDLNNLKGQTVFVTGGTGFFGVWLLLSLIKIRKILQGNLRIVALSRDPQRFLKTYPKYDFFEHVEFIKGDVKFFELNGIKVDYLIHMATTNAAETYEGEDQLNKLEMLYAGTRNVLEQCGSSLKNVLFTSSGVAYGKNFNHFISEDDFTGQDTCDTGSALGIGKVIAEYLIAYYAKKYGYRYSIARCFSFAGQYLPLELHYAFGNFVKDAIKHRDILINGDGQDKRSYLYIGDAVAWLLRLLTEPKNQIYNVGSDQSLTIAELAGMVAGQTKANIKVRVLQKDGEQGNFTRLSYIPSIKKIKNDYPGLDIWTGTKQTIDKMLH